MAIKRGPPVATVSALLPMSCGQGIEMFYERDRSPCRPGQLAPSEHS